MNDVSTPVEWVQQNHARASSQKSLCSDFPHENALTSGARTTSSAYPAHADYRGVDFTTPVEARQGNRMGKGNIAGGGFSRPALAMFGWW